MNVSQFIARWRRVALTERSASQRHFLDLCEVLDHPKPAEADPIGEWFTLERRVPRSTREAHAYNPLQRAAARLALAHEKLDAAAFAAYGWDSSMGDEGILEKLLEMNLERAGPAQCSRE